MTSSVIANLRVQLGLDSAQFRTGMTQSEQLASKFGKRLAGLAGAGIAALKGAMLAAGVSAINTGAEIQRLSQVSGALPEEFQRWASAAKTVGIEQEKMADIFKDMNDRVGDFVQTGGGPMADFFENVAPKIGVTAEQFRNLSGPQALQLYVDSLEKANLNQQDMTFYMEAMASDSTLLLPLLKNGGQALSDYADRAQRLGAILSGDALAALQKGKAALSEMRLAAQGMSNTLGVAAVPAVQALAAIVTSAAGFIVENFSQIQGTIIAAAGAVTLYYTPAIFGAIAATGTWIASLITLKGAIAATGIGVFAIIAGALIGKFLDLVKASGGFGEALTLVKDLGKQAFTNLGQYALGWMHRASAAFYDIKSAGITLFADLIEKGVDFGNRYIGIYRGAFEAIKAIWGLLPQAMGDLAVQAANNVIAKVEGMLKSAAGAIDWFTGGLAGWLGKDGTNLAGGVNLSRISNEFEGAAREAGAAASSAFAEGFNTNTFNTPDLAGMRGAAIETEMRSAAQKTLSGIAFEQSGDWSALDALKNVLTSYTSSASGAADTTTLLNNNLGDLGGSGGGKGKSGKGNAEAVKEALDGIIKGYEELKAKSEAGASAMADMFMGLVDGTKSLKSAIADLLSQMAKVAMNKVFMGLANSGMGGGFFSGLGSMLGFANGTNNYPGGFARINERGGEIVKLPSGSQVIPHDISKRMADGAGGSVGGTVMIGFDQSTGSLTAYFRNVAGEVVSQASSSIVSQSVQATKAAQARGYR